MARTTLRATDEAANTLRQLALVLSVQLGRRVSVTEVIGAAAHLAAARPAEVAKLIKEVGK